MLSLIFNNDQVKKCWLVLLFYRDAGVMFSDGTFKILGRILGNERFKIFGKVEYPGPIEEIMCMHTDISQAYVSWQHTY